MLIKHILVEMIGILVPDDSQYAVAFYRNILKELKSKLFIRERTVK